MRAWLWLIAGAAAEVGWIAGLRFATTAIEWTVTVISAAASVGLALGATRDLPATTVYTLFVGLGAFGAMALQVAFLDTDLSPAAYGFMIFLIVCVIGLKRTGGHA